MITIFLIGGIGVIGVAAALFINHLQKSSTNQPKGKGVLPKTHAEKLQSDIVLNSIADGVVIVDKEGVIQLFNPAAARLTGWQQSEATGLSHTAVLHFANPKNQEFTGPLNPFTKVITEGRAHHDNTGVLITRSQKVLATHLSVSPLFDSSQTISGAVGIFRDVTEEREEERQRAEFISTASHEMRTPVASIEGYLALAMNEKVSSIDQRARTYLLKAHESTQHLGRLFQDLLTSARAEDGRLSNHPLLTELGSFLERLTEDLRFSAQKKDLALEYIVGTTGTPISPDEEGHRRVVQPLYHVLVDPERLREVVTNLFDNAVKYTEKGKISIGITGDDKVVQIYIKDTGSGIPPEDIPHLFQKFYRVDSTATRTIGGTGLGLFISRKIVELYNGKIWVESKLNEGSTFYINLPRLTNEQVQQLQANPTGSPTITTLTPTNTGS